MAKRPVKVSGYVRTRRKGKSIIVTQVAGYERARPERVMASVTHGASGTNDAPAAQASERYTVEGVVCDASDFDTRYDIRQDGDVSSCPRTILDALHAMEGRRVRVTIEVLG